MTRREVKAALYNGECQEAVDPAKSSPAPSIFRPSSRLKREGHEHTSCVLLF